MQRGNEWWDKFFIKSAQNISVASKDPSTQVGCVIVKDKKEISRGFNGFPRGIEDTQERLNNREDKLNRVIHAEINCILFAAKSLQGCDLFTYPFLPCHKCAGLIIQVGIKRVIAPYNDNPRWIESFKLSCEYFKEAGVEIVLLDAPCKGFIYE